MYYRALATVGTLEICLGPFGPPFWSIYLVKSFFFLRPMTGLTNRPSVRFIDTGAPLTRPSRNSRGCSRGGSLCPYLSVAKITTSDGTVVGIGMKRWHDTTFTFFGEDFRLYSSCANSLQTFEKCRPPNAGRRHHDRSKMTHSTNRDTRAYNSFMVSQPLNICSISIRLRGVNHRFTTSSGSILETIDLVKQSDSGHCRAQTDDPTKGYQFL